MDLHWLAPDDDLALLIVGKFLDSIYDLRGGTIRNILNLCSSHVMSINAGKTELAQVTRSKLIQGVTLDSRLTQGRHLVNMTRKAIMAIWVCRRTGANIWWQVAIRDLDSNITTFRLFPECTQTIKYTVAGLLCFSRRDPRTTLWCR